MKSKTKTQSTNTNTYQQIAPDMTAERAAFNANIDKAYGSSDPSINYQFANAREGLNNSYANPFGANISPEVQQASLLNANQQLNQAQGQALREDQFNRRNAKTQALGAAAGMAAPQLVQTGGTSTGMQTTNPGIGGLLMAGIGAAGQVGAGAMT